eukprot:Nitzschia sp. Nitz4//scaffold2_size372955//136626//139235//NITZ4_000401-RA/size372955-processed-gene-0.411-mRNA-1//1//CDS//3329546712//334//frame0
MSDFVTAEMAFPNYVVVSNATGPGFYIFVLAYTAFAFFLIGPMVTWSRSIERNALLEEENAAEAPVQPPVATKPSNQSADVSSLAGSHAPSFTSKASRQSARSTKSGALSGILRGFDRAAATEYPDNNPDFRSRKGGRTVISKPGTSRSDTPSQTHSAATTSRLHGPSPSNKNLSSLVLDVGGRRWNNRRPIGRADVIQNAIRYERAGSAVSGQSASKGSNPPNRIMQPKRSASKGMSDVASSMLEEQSHEVMRVGAFMHPPRTSMNPHRTRFVRRGSRAGSNSAASERSIMSSIVDDITPNDAADANDPGKGNIFVTNENGVKSTVAMDSPFGSDPFSVLARSLLELAAPGEEVSRVSCLLRGEGNVAKLAGQYVQHAIFLQLVLGVPLLYVWTEFMEDVVYWLVKSSEMALIAKQYTRIVVFYYLAQSLARTCTVTFHICGHEHFESVIDLMTSSLQVAGVACVVNYVDTATLTTVGYIQVLIGVAGAVAKVMYPVMRGWMKPLRRSMFFEIALFHNPGALKHLVRAVIPLFLGSMLEYGEWEVLTLLLCHIGSAEVATWALLGAVWDVLEAMTEGIGEAAAIQVAFLLAALQPERARRLANTAIYMAVVEALLVTSALYMSGRHLAVLFTNDRAMQHMFNDTIGFIGIANVTMTFAQISWSLIGAQGRFRLATLVMFVARWVVTIPVALVATYVYELDLESVSGSLVVGYATASCILTYLVLRSDWVRLARVMQDMDAEKLPLEDDDEYGDPFDDFDDSSDSSEGFGLGGNDMEQASDGVSRGASVVSGMSRNKQKVSRPHR